MHLDAFIVRSKKTRPVKMEQTKCSETSAHQIQTSENHLKNTVFGICCNYFGTVTVTVSRIKPLYEPIYIQ